ncbi:MAG: Na(+)/H(+) antiporter subunit D [Sandaracinaceae bacterium]
MNALLQLGEQLFPGELLMLGALLLPLLPARARGAWMVFLPLLSGAHLMSLEMGYEATASIAGFDLEVVRVDRLSRIFGMVFHIAAFLGSVYAWHVKRTGELMAMLFYAGSAIGATFAGDLITLFLFWEITAISSVFLVWARAFEEPSRRERAYRSGMRYLSVQVGSGVLLLMGLLLHRADTGSVAFTHIGLDASRGAPFLFAAFAIKAAFPMLHNWVQDAYPEATVSGTVLLAGFTTKLAIYALARGFAGTDLLIPIGAAMAAFPIFFAVLENDLRRVLAYSLNNQLGFMVVGVGIGTQLAINGAAAHAFAHILYKGLLLMSVGAVLYRTGTVDASRLGGLHKSMPLTTVFCIIGALSISAFPLFSGFVTKSMIVSAVGDAHLPVTFGVLLFASAGVCDHSGIKVPFFAFFAHDQGWRVKEAPIHMLIAMGLTASLCIGIGLMPGLLYQFLPFPGLAAEYHAYETTHVITMLELLLFAGLAFIVLVRLGVYPPEVPAVNVDTDWVYRKLTPRVVHRVYAMSRQLRRDWAGVLGPARDALLKVVRTQHAPPRGPLGEPWSAGRTALWAALLLGLLLLVHYGRG